jgi:hypothetical protein
MVDFRKMMLLMVVLALTAGFASAQFLNPLQCVANAGIPPPVRAEGLAEEVGQVVITCTGGAPTPAGQPIPTVNVQIYLSATTTLSSRLLSGNASEAMLLVDEPNAISGTPSSINRVQTLCPAPGNCAMVSAIGNGTDNYIGGAGRPNVFQAVKSSENSVTWLGVPIDPPGTTGNRVIRLTNVRANAAQAYVPGLLVPSQIQMFITISGTGSLPVANNILAVAYVQKGMDFSATGGNYNQCEPGNYNYSVRFTEKFGTAFRNNNAYDTVSASNKLYPPTMQWVPGAIYNTESMWSNSNLSQGGIASQGTRLIARFLNIPANITLSVANSGTSTDGDIANLVTGHDTSGALGTVTSYTVAAGGSTTIITSNNAVSSGMAVWEVITSNPGAVSTITFNVTVSYVANPLPGLTTLASPATVTGNYGPTSDVPNQAPLTIPAPRFLRDETSATTFVINPCQTNLLFPYITNAPGFDTGLAISNTTADPYATPDQQGVCTLYYYGTVSGGVAADSVDTSAVVPAGKQLIWTLSAGGGVNAATIAPSVLAKNDFTGYLIARCNFQYAHGYAFISDLGIRNWAQGYVALVLDQGLGTYNGTISGSSITLTPPVTRTGVKSESLNN